MSPSVLSSETIGTFLHALAALMRFLIGLCRIRKNRYDHPKLTRFPQAHSTIVPQSSLCPTRRWSGEMVGVGMLRGAGGVQISKFPIFKFSSSILWISKFTLLNFYISNVQIFNVECSNFQIPKLQKQKNYHKIWNVQAFKFEISNSWLSSFQTSKFHFVRI